MKATVFVTPEFVDPRPVVRPQVPLHEYDETTHRPESCCAGFLSWDELRAMEASGLVDIQAHGLTHTWYEASPQIVDFWRPGAATCPAGIQPFWLLWNRFPAYKPFYLTEAPRYETRVPWGTPVYAHKKSLAVRRYFPDPDLETQLVEHVSRNGNAGFFSRPDWEPSLHTAAVQYRDRYGENGRYETDAEMEDRLRHELTASKQLLETKLDKEITCLCWPGGGISEQVLQLAREAGYRSFTLPSGWHERIGTPAARGMISRMASSAAPIIFHGRNLGVPSARYFAWQAARAGGSRLHTIVCRAWIIMRLLRSLCFSRKGAQP